MTILDSPRVSRRARAAVTAVFFLNGLMIASYVVRLPSLKADLQLSSFQVGLASTLFGACAVVAMQFVGGLVARYGSAWLIRFGLLAMPLVLAGFSFTDSFAGLAVASVFFGAVHGSLDVSMNAHAVAVERELGRAVMSRCHAAWSISAVAAAAGGATIISSGLGVAGHFAAVAAVVVVGGLALWPGLLSASADRVDRSATAAAAAHRPGWRARWSRAVVMLGLTGTVLMVCEGAALTWSGVLLHEERGASLTLASMALVAFSGCQTLARLVGDRLTQRFGPARLFRLGGLVGAAGFALVVASPHPVGGVAGFAVVGVGTALLIPIAFSAAGHAGGSGPGAAAFVARFTTFAYAGILLGPAAIGLVAQGIGLQWTLALLVPLLGITVLVTRLPAARDARGHS
ncbi:MFS transporter [Allorhizocola rhizosphaerae]|uniref:MFS transporter n=1 Tax=Allorhizocola rhizosphaerae TaxID=1872709 RepID=UPI000E3D3516|nr:MFS transporter [Allorhizocola rhizosphaerae]